MTEHYSHAYNAEGEQICCKETLPALLAGLGTPVMDVPMYSDNELRAAVALARKQASDDFLRVFQSRNAIVVHNLICGCQEADCQLRQRAFILLGAPGVHLDALPLYTLHRLMLFSDGEIDQAIAGLDHERADRLRDILK
jgi:hypothetical protein